MSTNNQRTTSPDGIRYLRNSESVTASAVKQVMAQHGQKHLIGATEELDVLRPHFGKTHTVVLYCQFSGIPCGKVELPAVAGIFPLIEDWRATQIAHPVFSLTLTELLNVADSYYKKYIALLEAETSEKVVEGINGKKTIQKRYRGSRKLQAAESRLQVIVLAVLHNLTVVKHDRPWLPDLLQIIPEWEGLLTIGRWAAMVDSRFVKFPSLRISKLETKINLAAFVEVATEIANKFTNNVKELEYDELDYAVLDRTLAAIKSPTPTSPKLLWRWIVKSLPVKYAADLEGWMKEIFFAKKTGIDDYTLADVNLFESFILAECEIGSLISHEVLNVLADKRKLLAATRAYEIIEVDELTLQAATGVIAVAEPLLSEYPSRVKFLVAHAKWKLTHGAEAAGFHRNASNNKLNKVSVTIKVQNPKQLVIGGKDIGTDSDWDESTEVDMDDL